MFPLWMVASILEQMLQILGSNEIMGVKERAKRG